MKYKIISGLLIGVVALMVSIVVFSTVDFLLEMFSGLATLSAVLIALIIPFVLKDIEHKKEKETEQKRLPSNLSA